MGGLRESVRGNVARSLKALRGHGRRLVELNVELFQAEMKVLAARFGAAVAMVVLAALLGFFGLGFLLATGAIVLDLVLPLWSSVLIVAVLLFLLAAILVLAARSQIRAARKPVPQKAIAEARRTAETVKAGVRTVGRRAAAPQNERSPKTPPEPSGGDSAPA